MAVETPGRMFDAFRGGYAHQSAGVNERAQACRFQRDVENMAGAV